MKKKDAEKRLTKVRFGINMKATILVMTIVLLSFAAALVASVVSLTFVAITENVYGDRMLGRTFAIMIDQEATVRLYEEGRAIYENTPEELRRDPDSSEYLARYTHLKDEDYLKLRDQLEELCSTNGLKWVDLRIIDEANNRFVYLMDTENRYDQGYATGSWLYEDDTIYTFLSEDVDKENGELSLDVDALVTITTSGTMGGQKVFCTLAPFYHPDTGELIGYIGIGEEVSLITDDIKIYVSFFMIIAVIFVIIVVFVSRRLIRHWIIKPVRKLTRAAKEYAGKDDKLHTDPVFAKLKIRTHDEIRLLADSMKDMELDLASYIENVTALTAEQERIGAELSVAEQIQSSMLPEELTGYEGERDFEISSFMNPAREVGGDFYDYFVIDEDHIGLSIADVSGKGIPAALFMAICKTLLKNAAMEYTSPARVVEKVNRQLCENNPEMMFVTAWFGIYTVSTHTIVYVNAGHEDPAVYRSATGRYDLLLEDHDIVLGFDPSLSFTEHTLILDEGDRIFEYTDGVPEATSSDDVLYSTDRMIACLNANSSCGGNEVFDALISDISGFILGAEQFDDMTMLLFERKKPL